MVANLNERQFLLIFSMLLISAISILHAWAMENYIYFFYWWFDIFMHFLGGLWVGVTFLWFYFFSGLFSNQTLLERRRIFWFNIGALIFMALSWEVFEIFAQRTIDEPNFISDTTIDIIMGLLGALVAYRYFVFSFLENKQINEVRK